MTRNKKAAVALLCAVLALTGACAFYKFRKLGFRDPSSLTKELNAILTQQGAASVPQMTDDAASKGNEGWTRHYSATTSTGLGLSAGVDKSGKESLSLLLPAGKMSQEESVEEFVVVAEAVIIHFAGVEYVTPVEEALFVRGKTVDGVYSGSFTHSGTVFRISIDQSGYVFSYESED